MPKNDEAERLRQQIDEITKWKLEKQVEDGIRKGLNKWLAAICVTATSATLTSAHFLGGLIYSRWDAFKAAIDAWVKASGGGE